jgi:predicted amidohydrolase YtcJ
MTELVELEGRTLVPGFYDAHQHQIYAGLARTNVDARVGSIAELINRIRRAAAVTPPARWIEGGGWDEAQLAEGRAPSVHDLNLASREHPVYLTRTCGHVMAVNTAALAGAQIDRATPDPPGGRVERDAAGNPTGVLYKRAMELVRRVVPPPNAKQIEHAILMEVESNLDLGITSIWEPSVEPSHVEVYQKLSRQGQSRIRVTLAQERVLRTGEMPPLPRPFRSQRLSLVGIKLFQDGALGARSAALSIAYRDEPENRGILVWEQSELDQHVAEAHDAGLQVSIHAIGDVAIESALTAIERANRRHPRINHRHRIEHCALPTGNLPSRIAEAGVVAVAQPFFLWFHGERYVRNISESLVGDIYPLARLLAAGVPMALSSDAPIVPDRNPLFGIQCASRRFVEGGRALVPNEAIDVETALTLFTVGAAYAAHEDHIKGSLSPGKLADLVVLKTDLTSVGLDEISQVGIDAVYVGGARMR